MTFQEYAAQNYGLLPEALKECQLLHSQPDVVAAVASVAQRLSESYRVSAITSEGNRSIEALGKWKAMQELSDYLKNRVRDFGNVCDDYREATRLTIEQNSDSF